MKLLLHGPGEGGQLLSTRICATNIVHWALTQDAVGIKHKKTPTISDEGINQTNLN
tara:strand:- start:393 stop:560 length:168 start_codon:yes stop_codon:yes gene_type:complete